MKEFQIHVFFKSEKKNVLNSAIQITPQCWQKLNSLKTYNILNQRSFKLFSRKNNFDKLLDFLTKNKIPFLVITTKKFKIIVINNNK